MAVKSARTASDRNATARANAQRSWAAPLSDCPRPGRCHTASRGAVHTPSFKGGALAGLLRLVQRRADLAQLEHPATVAVPGLRDLVGRQVSSLGESQQRTRRDTQLAVNDSGRNHGLSVSLCRHVASLAYRFSAMMALW